MTTTTATELNALIDNPHYTRRLANHIKHGNVGIEKSRVYIIEDVVDDRVGSFEMFPELVAAVRKLRGW